MDFGGLFLYILLDVYIILYSFLDFDTGHNWIERDMIVDNFRQQRWGCLPDRTGI
jgi:hypothetical protein